MSGRFQAAADPVVRAGTNGMFFYAGLAFDRATSATSASTVSSIFVARYNDLNNNEQIDPITYIDTHIVASGNSTQFLDKPSMAVDIPRAGAATCSFTANEPGLGANGGSLAVHQSFAAGNIYLAYTDFLAATKANSTPTHLMITHSTDCGVTWSTPIQINTGTTTSQGSAIAVNPLTGAVYVAWRQFASTGFSDAIMVAQSTNAGKSFSAPVQISKFTPFDQGTTGTSFRTNAYPALTTDMFGFVYVAFSARGVSSSGDARVVAAGSLDGTHWTPAIMVDNPSQNAQTNPSGRGHQIMPAMTFANGRLTLLYYDLRLDHYADFYTPNPASLGNYTAMLEAQGELAPGATPAEKNQVFTPYIDDAGLTLRRHTLDLRVLELGIFPTITLGPSVLVSQYEFGCCVNPETEDIEQFKFNVPNLPLFDSGQEAFLGRLHRHRAIAGVCSEWEFVGVQLHAQRQSAFPRDVDGQSRRCASTTRRKLGKLHGAGCCRCDQRRERQSSSGLRARRGRHAQSKHLYVADYGRAGCRSAGECQAAWQHHV